MNSTLKVLSLLALSFSLSWAHCGSCEGQTQKCDKGHGKDHSAANSKEHTMEFNKVFQDYLKLQEALSSDNFTNAQLSAQSIQKNIGDCDCEKKCSFKDKETLKSIKEMSEAKDLAGIRKPFTVVSEHMITILSKHPDKLDQKAMVFICPMANKDKGGRWIQTQDDLKNPYFGASMLKCGSKVSVIN
jgi:Cu(I)/Ag(I) efflux system membrane fusion protein